MSKKIIDFTAGGWGHALHASTWSAVQPSSMRDEIELHKSHCRRYSVLVHVSPDPEVGDLIRYSTDDGPALAKVYEIERFRDPRDMFKLFIQRDRAFDLQHNVLRDDAALFTASQPTSKSEPA